MQGHAKIERTGSWSGFESGHVPARQPLDADEPSGELKRCYSTKERVGKVNCPGGLLRSRQGTASSSGVSVATGTAYPICVHPTGRNDEKLQDGTNVSECQEPPHSKSTIQCKGPCSMESCGDSSRPVCHSSTNTAATPSQTTVSSQRMHAMEAQLTELQQQLQHLKTAQSTMGVVSSPPSDTRESGLSLENMSRQLNIAKGEKHDMRSKIGELERDLALCHQKSKKENLSRQRLQAELRRLADMISLSHATEADEVDACRSEDSTTKEVLTENDVSALKEQLRIFEEDFTNERGDSERLRVQNMRLMKELEEAKRVIEEQQRQLLMYAHLASADTSVVLSPVNDGLVERRSRSVPSTPNSSPHSSNFTSKYTYNPKDSLYAFDNTGKSTDYTRQLPPEIRAMSDVVPRGVNRHQKHHYTGFQASRPPPNRISEAEDVFPISVRSTNNSLS